MTWQEIYQSKLTSAKKAVHLIEDGDTVVVGFGCGEAFGLENALLDSYKDFHDITIVNMLTTGSSPWCGEEMQGHFRLNCLFASASNRNAVSSGIADFTTCHFYEIPELLRERLRPRVALVMLSPPDEHGYCSFGTNVDYIKGVCDYADVILAQVNKHMPRTFGNSIIHVRDLTAIVEQDAPLPQICSVEISDVERQIGKYCDNYNREHKPHPEYRNSNAPC